MYQVNFPLSVTVNALDYYKILENMIASEIKFQRDELDLDTHITRGVDNNMLSCRVIASDSTVQYRLVVGIKAESGLIITLCSRTRTVQIQSWQIPLCRIFTHVNSLNSVAITRTLVEGDFAALQAF